MPRADAKYLPCRMIHGYGSPARGIFDTPCESIEAALRKGLAMSDGPADFMRNYTVVRIKGSWEDLEDVDSGVVDAIKREMMT